MMTYTAPDGHIIESVPLPNEVNYVSFCSNDNYSDGTYYSVEVCSADSEIGVQAIHITRIVDNNSMNITIKEFSDKELIEYINNNKLI